MTVTVELTRAELASIVRGLYVEARELTIEGHECRRELELERRLRNVLEQMEEQ